MISNKNVLVPWAKIVKLSNAGSWLQNKKCSDIELSTDDFTFLKVLTPGVSYSLCKVHKAIVDICPPLRPVLSVVETPTYKMLSFCYIYWVAWQLTTVTDSFSFAKGIVEQDSSFCMGSLDVDSFFPSILLDETINIYTESI